MKAAERRGKKNYFEIIMPSRVYAFTADKAEERDNWTAALQREKEKASGVVKGVSFIFYSFFLSKFFF